MDKPHTGGRPRKDDGLTKSERYRLKDVDAYRANKAAWARTPEQRAKRREYQRKWREANREKHNLLARGYHAKMREDPGYRAKRYAEHIRRQFGLDPDAYEQMLANQNGGCAICGKEPGQRRLHIDHDHATGVVRGLLCTRCNSSLGWFETHHEATVKYLGIVW